MNPQETVSALFSQHQGLVEEVVEHVLKRAYIDEDTLRLKLMNILAGCSMRFDPSKGDFVRYARASMYRACKGIPRPLTFSDLDGFEDKRTDEDGVEWDWRAIGATLGWLKTTHPPSFEVIMLRAQGLTYDQMGEHLSRAPSTAHDRLKRARKLAQRYYYQERDMGN